MDINQRILNGVKEFPTLPTIYTTLLDVMANPRSTVSDVASVITNDIAATTKILKTVNSSLYGFSRRIDTVTQAVFQLGYNEIKNLVVAMSIIDKFNDKKSVKNFNLVDFWKHSLAVGVITRFIGRSLGVHNVENYLLSGMLHDIGKLVSYRSLNEEYTQVLNLTENNEMSVTEAELKVLGTSHCEIGAMIAEHWNMPDTIKNCILYHNKGISQNDRLQVAAVHLANIIARTMEYGYSGDNLVPKPNVNIWQILNLPPDILQKSLNIIEKEYSDTVSILVLN